MTGRESQRIPSNKRQMCIMLPMPLYIALEKYVAREEWRNFIRDAIAQELSRISGEQISGKTSRGARNDIAFVADGAKAAEQARAEGVLCRKYYSECRKLLRWLSESASGMVSRGIFSSVIEMKVQGEEGGKRCEFPVPLLCFDMSDEALAVLRQCGIDGAQSPEEKNRMRANVEEKLKETVRLLVRNGYKITSLSCGKECSFPIRLSENDKKRMARLRDLRAELAENAPKFDETETKEG